MLFALLRDLGVPGSVASTDACATAHSISPETYAALKKLLNKRKSQDTVCRV